MRGLLQSFIATAVGVGLCCAVSAAPPASQPEPFERGLPSSADYFPLAVWLQSPAKAAQYKVVGINLYVGLWKGPTAEQIADLEKARMPVICAQNAYALAHLDEKTIVGWLMDDEPDNAQQRGSRLTGYGPPIQPQKVVQIYEQMTQRDPSRPVLLNLGQGVAWDGWFGRGARSNHPEDYPQYVKAGDIVSFDIYPVTHDRPQVAGKIEFVGRGVGRLVKWTDNSKPVWACIETSHVGNPNALPTPQQVRSEVWMAIIHGARGIIYFSHEFKPKFIEAGMLAHPEIARAVRELNAQITRLAPVINSPTVPDAAAVSSSDPNSPITLMVKRHGHALYVFAVCESATPTRGSFHLREMPNVAKIEVLDESRQLPVSGGQFEDAFDGYGVHLYRIAGEQAGTTDERR